MVNINFFPFGNLRELNLDWFIAKWNEFRAEWRTQQSEWQQAQSNIDSAVASVTGKLDKSETAGRFLYAHNGATQTEIELPLSVGNGGTGSSDAAAARDALGVTEIVNNKLDKRTNAGNYLYSHSGDLQSQKEYQSYPTPNDIVMFNTSGNVQTGTPTQNIEATNKEYVDEQLRNKVDKKTTVGTFLYGHLSGTEIEKEYAATPTAGAIAEFNSAGNLETGTPTENNEAVNKAYADSLSGNPAALALEAIPFFDDFSYSDDGYYTTLANQTGITFVKNKLSFISLGTSSTYRSICLFGNHGVNVGSGDLSFSNATFANLPIPTSITNIDIALITKVTNHTSNESNPPYIVLATRNEDESYNYQRSNSIVAPNTLSGYRAYSLRELLPQAFTNGNFTVNIINRSGSTLNLVYSIIIKKLEV